MIQSKIYLAKDMREQRNEVHRFRRMSLAALDSQPRNVWFDGKLGGDQEAVADSKARFQARRFAGR